MSSELATLERPPGGPDAATVDVTVALATHGRPDDVLATLASIHAAVAASVLTCEVLVVANAPTAGDLAALDEAKRRWPDLRIEREDVPGKSRALNRFLPGARGAVLVLTDDDVRVPPGWVEAMAGPILRGEADAVQGRIRLAPYAERPWLRGRLRGALAEYLLDTEHVELVGANMALSRESFAAVGFDERLGPGTRYFADDTMLTLQLRRHGFRLAFAEDADVEHHLEPFRVERRYLLGHAIASGRTNAWVHRHLLHRRTRWSAVKAAALTARAWWLGGRRPEGWAISEAEYAALADAAFHREMVRLNRQAPSYARWSEQPGARLPVR